MSNSYLYSYPILLKFTEEDRAPGDLVFDREHEGRFVYLSGSPLDYPEGLLLGAWASDGTILEPMDPVFQELRPLGNWEGDATGVLDYHHWMGDAVRHQQEIEVEGTLAQYPEDAQPIVLTMERYWDDTAGWEGWGWRATVEFGDPARRPDARAIGIYNSDWGYLYTTGAFIWTDTGESDDEGNPVYKWQTHNPPGRATADKEPLYYALLFGAAQEGKMSLPTGRDFQQYFFWDKDQNPGYVPPVQGEWVDSSQTTAGMAGTVLLVQDNFEFQAGDKVRIDGVESMVTSLWTSTGLTLDPYQAYDTGLVVELWQ